MSFDIALKTIINSLLFLIKNSDNSNSYFYLIFIIIIKIQIKFHITLQNQDLTKKIK